MNTQKAAILGARTCKWVRAWHVCDVSELDTMCAEERLLAALHASASHLAVDRIEDSENAMPYEQVLAQSMLTPWPPE
eukprot:3621322-Amphidinium_carterae.1